MKFCFDIYLLLGIKIKCKRFKGKKKEMEQILFIQAAATVFCGIAFCVELILSPKLNAMPWK